MYEYRSDRASPSSDSKSRICRNICSLLALSFLRYEQKWRPDAQSVRRLFRAQRSVSKMPRVPVGEAFERTTNTRDYNGTRLCYGRRDFQTVNSGPLNSARCECQQINANLLHIYVPPRHRGRATYFHCFTTVCQY